MAKIFISGSADGLGQLAAIELIEQGHQVVLHARNQQRAREALAKAPKAGTVLIADLSDIGETKRLAGEVNKLGAFDAIIHNAGVYQAPGQILNVNTIAPYILTCLIRPPKRLVYMSSGMHTGGDTSMGGLRAAPPIISYADSKLHDLILAKAVARKWPQVYANAVDPGWVPTRMGGKGAPDNLRKGYLTQVWLAVSDDPDALVSGKYFHHQRETNYQLKADDLDIQELFLRSCADITGLSLPTA